MKFKNLFKTPKKAILTSLSLVVAVGLIGAGSVFAVEAAAEKKAIGKAAAEKIAITDAGVDTNQTRMDRTEFEYENGHYIYDVEFIANGKEYDYWIDAYEGRVLYKEVEVSDERPLTTELAQPIKTEAAKELEVTKRETAQKQEATTKPETTQKPEATTKPEATKEPEATTKPEVIERITANKAKSMALANAGLTASDVTFTKVKLEKDDGILVYEIEFYSSTREYEYEIHAYTGKVISKSSEALETTKEETVTYIGVDKAKSIAVKHAGLTLSEVRFSKAKLENDDGKVEYEIEFYHNNIEYEYTIDATKGTILEFESEEDD